MFDKLKKAKDFWDKHGSKIESALIHGKKAVEKGREFIASEEGQKALNFAKEKLRKQDCDKIQSNEGVANSANHVTANFGFADIMNVANKAKEIYEEDLKDVITGFQNADDDDKKDSIGDESNDDLNDKKAEEDVVDVLAEPIIEKDEPQDTFFEDKRDELIDAAKRGVMNLNNPEEVLNALCKLQSVANETIKYTEEQETKRAEINAKKEVAIEKIKTIEHSIKDYLDKTFDERRSIFAKEFECVDAALKTGNLELLSVSLNSINSFAAQSPFKALADVAAVQKNLLDTNTEWDI
ncbi:hypothetical protein SAMN05720470_11425 [Fibrobacter sp. UWOV1]|uniref:hypothetical protein n=1 Tax=Fibrobacter sp. UWOV1 TaxID=1896215 RepID=UPI0009112866|nr:hypothetical protein [Fibrobacter sp. UWOV1]SHL74463.1 hypothetical protein SAMN05720470_11425 [Fibrobacter sp. UWOV1]